MELNEQYGFAWLIERFRGLGIRAYAFVFEMLKDDLEFVRFKKNKKVP